MLSYRELEGSLARPKLRRSYPVVIAGEGQGEGKNIKSFFSEF